MPMIKQDHLLTEREYLEGELHSEVKHELVNGYVYAMSGASKNHDTISGNLYSEFRSSLKGHTCRPFGSDVKVKTPNDNFRYPDCMVVCEDVSNNEYYTESPTIIVEVLSRSTRKVDETIKFMEYMNIPSLQEYVLIEQDIVDVTVCRRSDNWRASHYFMGDEIYFESIDSRIAVEDIYLRVNNEDVIEFLKGD